MKALRIIAYILCGIGVLGGIGLVIIGSTNILVHRFPDIVKAREEIILTGAVVVFLSATFGHFFWRFRKDPDKDKPTL